MPLKKKRRPPTRQVELNKWLKKETN